MNSSTVDFNSVFGEFFNDSETPAPSPVTEISSTLKACPAWFRALAKEAYINDEPSFIDASTGNPIPGIYLNVPNDVYHAINAISSSHIKTFADSPYKYQQVYLIGKEKQINPKSREVGTISHEVILEGIEVYQSRRFTLLSAEDYPKDLHSFADIKDECARLGLSVSGNTFELSERLRSINEAQKVFDHRQQDWLALNMGEDFVAAARQTLLNKGEWPNSAEIIKLSQIASQNTSLPTPRKMPVTKEIHNMAMGMVEAVERNTYAKKLFKNGIPEVTFITLDPDTEMLTKCKVDWLSFIDDCAVPLDLKSARSANPYMASYQFAELRYDLQAAFYQRVMKPHLEEKMIKRLFPFVTIETGQFNICEIIELDASDWEIAEQDVFTLLTGMKAASANDIYQGYTESGRSVIKLGMRKSADAAVRPMCTNAEG